MKANVHEDVPQRTLKQMLVATTVGHCIVFLLFLPLYRISVSPETYGRTWQYGATYLAQMIGWSVILISIALYLSNLLKKNRIFYLIYTGLLFVQSVLVVPLIQGRLVRLDAVTVQAWLLVSVVYCGLTLLAEWLLYIRHGE